MSEAAQLSKIPSPGPKLVTVFLYGLVMLLLFWIGTKILFSSAPELTDEETVRSAERADIKVKYMEVVDKELNRYAWKDAAAGTVQIPVERAMELEVQTLSQNQEIRAAYPIDPLAVPATPAPTAEPLDAAVEFPTEAAAAEAAEGTPDVVSPALPDGAGQTESETSPAEESTTGEGGN